MGQQRTTLMRVVVAALALCAVSFAVGVVGDLSLASQAPGPSASVAIPPDAIRAHPLPPLPRTDSASAAENPRPARLIHIAAPSPREKPRAPRAKGEIKRDPDRAPKPVQAKH